MEIELERTFLVKEMPEGLEKCKFFEIIDVYLPAEIEHPTLRVRKSGDKYSITKKEPIQKEDSSEQSEKTIILTKEEFEGLARVKGKKIRKIRYYYPWDARTVEIDVFLDDLEGLVTADFEFKTREEKDNFIMPEFCLADVTQEKGTAGGILAGKKYADIQPVLEKYNYKKITNN